MHARECKLDIMMHLKLGNRPKSSKKDSHWAAQQLWSWTLSTADLTAHVLDEIRDNGFLHESGGSPTESIQLPSHRRFRPRRRNFAAQRRSAVGAAAPCTSSKLAIGRPPRPEGGTPVHSAVMRLRTIDKPPFQVGFV